MTPAKKTAGTLAAKGRDIACLHLEDQGWEVVERGWKGKSGKADIIARNGDVLAFIEVKTSQFPPEGLPEEAVGLGKRREYEDIAAEYIFTHELDSTRIRFDAMALLLSDDGKAFLRHHADAFGVGL